ncbi:cupredoxin domain-containing protein [Neobacillus sp. FSL H8-0543]|uniref:cupredoxin domain-containing protein n=1 Tax=Neobacillus sp. FSL H8-0543 TaxID=2954672 RepID=UPI003158434B
MTILTIFAIAIMSLLTGYSLFLLHRGKEKLNFFSGTIISMAISTMVGLLSGYLIGVQTGEFFLPVGIGMLVGFIVGFLVGQPIGVIAILGGSVSGLLSGIVGAFVGAIIQFENPAIMLGILLILFVIILGLVILFIFSETKEKFSLSIEKFSPLNIFSGGLILIALFLFLYSSDFVKVPGKDEATQPGTPAETSGASITELDITKDTDPKIKMTVTPTGYSPNVIRVKKGAPVELEITNPGDNSCFSIFMMPDFGLNDVNLKAGTTKLAFTPDKTGQYTFHCGMNMFKGTIIVE